MKNLAIGSLRILLQALDRKSKGPILHVDTCFSSMVTCVDLRFVGPGKGMTDAAPKPYFANSNLKVWL